MAGHALPGDQSAEALTLFDDREYSVSYQEGWEGPMPPPAVLRGYEQVVPGAAARILEMAEKALTGHVDRDNRLAEAEVDIAKTGQTMAFLLTLIALIASIVFFAKGNEVAGGFLIGLPVVLLIRSFLPSSGGQPLTPPPDSAAPPGPAPQP